MSGTGDQISDVLVDAIVVALTEALQTETDKADPAYVPHIQGGKLQADPVRAGETWGHSIEVHIGDPDSLEDTWIDELAGPDDHYIKFPHAGGLPIAEISGGSGFAGLFWWRRGTVDINSFFLAKGYERDVARQVHGLLRRRVEQVLGDASGGKFLGLTDDSGREQVIFFMPVKSKVMESGGPPSQFIWRGKVWWQALVGRT